MTEIQIELEDSAAKGKLGVSHLKRLWSRSIRDRAGLRSETNAGEWGLDNVVYHGLNLPIEETIQYLYQHAPTFEEFEDWVLAKNGGRLYENTVARINTAVDALTRGGEAGGERNSRPARTVLGDEDLEFWNDNGYLVVSGLFSADEIRSAADAVWRHLEMDPDDPDTWYRRKSDHGIMVQFFDHPALEAIRRSPNLKSVFAQIWNTDDLWVSTDRVSFNPPERPGHEFRGPRLHWDVSLERPIPFGVQGLVYLTDTPAEQGAFTCIPGFHTKIDRWLDGLASDADPRDQDLEKLGATPIPGAAGDLVIWHQALPHGSSPNRLTRPRIVEYVTMFPADATHAGDWK